MINKCRQILTQIFFVCFFLTFSQNGLTQNKIIRFSHYTTENGLSQNMIDCMMRDHKGFMWFGTWNGLNRFDGYNFTVYKQSSNNSHTISNNFVRSICQDSFQNIWVATRHGLNLYYYKKDRFVNYFHDESNVNSISSNDVTVVFYDSYGFLWVGTAENGLNRIKLGTESSIISVEHIYSTNKVGSLSDNRITCIYEDSKRNLWVGTQNGLNQFIRKTNQFIVYTNIANNPNSISSNTIQDIFEDSHGDLWIGTDFGLNRIDHNTNWVYRYYYDPDNSNSLSHNAVRAIVEDKKGNVIIGTLGGLSFFNRSSNNFTNFKYRLHDRYGLNNDFINCLLADSEGNLWIGTEKGGINKTNIHQHRFEWYENEVGNANSLSHNTINSVFEDNDYLWIGTAGGGLNIYDKKKKKYYHFLYDSHNPNSISSDFITSIFRDSKGNTWISTWGSGINFLPKGKELSGHFLHYNATGQPNSLVNPFVSSIIEDKHGRLFIGTYGGLSIFDLKTNKFESFVGSGNPIPVLKIGCLLFDIQENLWVGTENGLFQIIPTENGLIDPVLSRYNVYFNKPDDKHSLSGNYVISICSDKEGNMWFGTYGYGLNLLVPNASAEATKFINFNENNGIASSVIYGILEDDEGNLWLSTDNGLSKFNYKKGICKNYYQSDGLLSNQFYWSAYFKNKNGKMYFGGMGGLNAFYPSEIVDDPNPPRMAFTDLKIYNQSVTVGEKYYGKISLPVSVACAQNIVLSYKANEFVIEFSALHYNQPEKNKYRYKLEGFDNHWIEVDSKRRFAIYTNLKGGKYKFYVLASNNDGKWAQEPISMNLTIVPPFWATWWFRALMVVIAIALIIVYNRWRVYSLEKQKRKLEILVEQRTATIEKQNEELLKQANLLAETNKQLLMRQQQIEEQKAQLEIQNAEIIEQRNRLMEMNKKVQLSQKQQLRLFTHISHEFRTPLTLILAPLEQLIKEPLGKPISEHLQIIYKNAQRLLHLVDQIMELRKIEAGKTELKLIETDIIRFVFDIVHSFHSVAQQKKIEFIIKSGSQTMIAAFDKEKVENIIYNLLSNAFKYTPENKVVFFNMEMVNSSLPHKDEILIVSPEKPVLTSQFIEIIVSDEGIGISNEQIKEIFKRFYRINTPFAQRTKGSGIGLYITREMVKEHYGYMYIKSTIGVGTTFRVLLPAGHYFQQAGFTIEKVNYLVPEVQKTATVFTNIVPISQKDTHFINPSNNHRYSVLIIDDDAELVSFISSSLSEYFKIFYAYNGREGIKLAIDESPDVVICDVMMPEMDGLEVCQQLKSELATSHIPVILLSAKAELENFVEGLEIGADDYIAKPFHIPVLVAKLRSLIENRERLKSLFTERIFPISKEITSNKIDEKFLERAIRIVNEHMSNSNFSVEDFAAELCISRSLLHKKLTSIVGLSANEFILSLRMKRAMTLIGGREKSIAEIAYQVGFSDPKYFSKCFKKYFGKSPSEFI